MAKYNEKFFTLAIFLYLIFITSIAQFVATPLAPILIDELGLNKTQLGFLASAVFWGIVSFGMIAGLATDKLGEKKMVLLGVFIISASLIFFSYGRTFITLLAASVFIGAGYSVINILTTSGLAKWFPINEKAFAIGLKQSGMPLGSAVGAAVLPLMALSYSWSYSVKILSIVVLTSGIACFFLYREKKEQKDKVEQPQTSLLTNYEPGLKEKPVTYFSLLKNKKMLIANLLGIGFVMNQIAVMTFTIPYLQETLSLSIIKAGQYLAFFQLSGGFSRPFFGFVGDRAFQGNRHYTLFSLAVITAALIFVLSLVSPDFPSWLITFVVVAAGFTSLGWYGPYFALITELAGKDSAGKALGYGVTINCLGISIGTPLFGFIADLTGNFLLSFRSFALFLILDAFIFFYLVGRTKYGRSSRTS